MTSTKSRTWNRTLTPSQSARLAQRARHVALRGVDRLLPQRPIRPSPVSHIQSPPTVTFIRKSMTNRWQKRLPTPFQWVKPRSNSVNAHRYQAWKSRRTRRWVKSMKSGRRDMASPWADRWKRVFQNFKTQHFINTFFTNTISLVNFGYPNATINKILFFTLKTGF